MRDTESSSEIILMSVTGSDNKPAVSLLQHLNLYIAGGLGRDSRSDSWKYSHLRRCDSSCSLIKETEQLLQRKIKWSITGEFGVDLGSFGGEKSVAEMVVAF